MKKDYDSVYNKLCLIYFQEENRLKERVDYLENLIRKSGYDTQTMLQYIQAVGNKEYFDRFMKDLLQYLKYFF